jgi:hypothetical protein
MIKVESFLNNALVLFLILLSGSVFHVGFFTPTYIVALLLVCFSLIYITNYSKKELFLFAFSLFIFIMILVINFIFSKSNDFKDYGILFMQILLSLLAVLSLKLRKADFKYHLYKVLYLLIILSLIGFILSAFQFGNRIDFGESGFSVYTILYIFFYSAELITEPITIYRNQGVFWEAGLLAVYANIFLLLSLFVYKNKKNSTIAIICILTTLSTTGIFILLIQVFFYTRKVKFGLVKKAALIIAVIPIIILVGGSFLSKKTEGEETAVSSFALRSFDLYSGAMITIYNPLFGVGLNKEAFLTERDKFLPPEMVEIYSLIEDRGNTNSILMLFTSLGIALGIFILYMLYKQNVFLEQKFLFFIIALLSLSSEPVLLTPFFMCFIFYGFHKTINLKLL